MWFTVHVGTGLDCQYVCPCIALLWAQLYTCAKPTCKGLLEKYLHQKCRGILFTWQFALGSAPCSVALESCFVHAVDQTRWGILPQGLQDKQPVVCLSGVQRPILQFEEVSESFPSVLLQVESNHPQAKEAFLTGTTSVQLKQGECILAFIMGNFYQNNRNLC